MKKYALLISVMFFSCSQSVNSSGPEVVQTKTGHITSLDYTNMNGLLAAPVVIMEYFNINKVKSAQVFFSEDSISWQDLSVFVNAQALESKMTTSDASAIASYSPQILIASNAVAVKIIDINKKLTGAWYKIVAYL